MKTRLKLDIKAHSVYDEQIKEAASIAQGETVQKVFESIQPKLGKNLQAYYTPKGDVTFVSQVVAGVDLAVIKIIEVVEE